MKARVNPRQFLTIDGLPVARVLPTGELEFKDKDIHRSSRRRTAYVTVTVEEIKQAVEQAVESYNESHKPKESE